MRSLRCRACGGLHALCTVEHVSHDLKMSIQQARLAKAWNQKQLAQARGGGRGGGVACDDWRRRRRRRAQAINEKVSVIGDYEAGRAIPSGVILAKLDRALGVHLPRVRGTRCSSAREGVLFAGLFALRCASSFEQRSRMQFVCLCALRCAAPSPCGPAAG